MKEVIEHILEAERQAQDILAQAKIQAENIIMTAQGKAAALREQARRDAYSKKEMIIASAHAETAKKREEIIDGAYRSAQNILGEKASLVQPAAERLFNKIINA